MPDAQVIIMFHVILLSVACCWLAAAMRVADNRSSEEALLSYLFDHGYNPTARPVFNSSLTVAVKLRFSLLQIQDLVKKLINTK